MKHPRKYLLFQARRGAIESDDYGTSLRQTVEPSAAAWKRFVSIALLALGLGLVVSGLLFLLAFNWGALGKWQKLGLAAAGVLLPAGLSATNLLSAFNRKLLLTAAAFMVGGLFAVFGQIYQTGADNYEYFLAWSLFITVWAIAVDFPALWLVWLAATNLTIYFHGEQILNDWRTFETLGIQVLFTGAVLIALSVHGRYRASAYSGWFMNAVALVLSSLAVITIFLTSWAGQDGASFYVVRLGVMGVILISVFIGYRQRWLGLMATMALAAVTSVAILIISANDDTAAFLITAVWVLASTTGSLIVLNLLRKEWLDTEEDKGAAAGAKKGVDEDQTGSLAPNPLVLEDAKNTVPLASGADDQLLADYLVEERESPSLGLQLLSICGGLLSMMAFIGLLVVMGVLDGAANRAILGGALIVVGVLLDRRKLAVFLDAILVSSITLGIILLMTGFIEYTDEKVFTTCYAAAALCSILLLLTRSKVVQVLMVIGFHVAILTSMVYADTGAALMLQRTYVLGMGLFLTAWMLGERYIVTSSIFLAVRYEAVRAGTLVALLMGALVVRWAGYLNGADGFYYSAGFPLVELLLIAAVYVGFVAIRRFVPDPNHSGWYALGLALLLFPFSLAPAAAPPLLVLLLSMKTGYRLGVVLGAAALLYFVGQYYYDLNVNLLNKSLLLAGTGAFFLIAYAVVRKKLATDEAAH